MAAFNPLSFLTFLAAIGSLRQQAEAAVLVLDVPAEWQSPARTALREAFSRAGWSLELRSRTELQAALRRMPASGRDLRKPLLSCLGKTKSNPCPIESLRNEMELLSESGEATLPWDLWSLAYGFRGNSQDHLKRYVIFQGDNPPPEDVRTALSPQQAATLGALRKQVRKSPPESVTIPRPWPESCAIFVEGNPAATTLPLLEARVRIQEFCPGSWRGASVTARGAGGQEWGRWQERELDPLVLSTLIRKSGVDGTVLFGRRSEEFVNGRIWLSPPEAPSDETTGAGTEKTKRVFQIPLRFSATKIEVEESAIPKAPDPTPRPAPTTTEPLSERGGPCSVGASFSFTQGGNLVLGHNLGGKGASESLHVSCRAHFFEAGLELGYVRVASTGASAWGNGVRTWRGLLLSPTATFSLGQWHQGAKGTGEALFRTGISSFTEIPSSTPRQATFGRASVGAAFSFPLPLMGAVVTEGGGGFLFSTRELLALFHFGVRYSW